MSATLVGSKVSLSPTYMVFQRLVMDRPAMTARPTVMIAIANRVHMVERTVRSFIHSDLRMLDTRRSRLVVGAGVVIVMVVLLS